MIAEADRQPTASRTEADVAAGADTGLLVYGVVEASTRIPEDLTGLDEVPVTSVQHGRVAAVVGEITLERPPGRRAELVAFSSVLDALAETGAVAPVQFGSVLLDEQAVVEELLAPNEEAFVELLSQLEGRAQFNLRATYLEDVVLAEVVASEPEIRELRELTRKLPEDAAYGERVRLGELVARALEQRSGDDSAMLLDAITPLVAGCTVRPGSGTGHVLDAALLVDDEHRDELVDRLEVLAEAVHERMRLRLVGPVAPYDFVGGT